MTPVKPIDSAPAAKNGDAATSSSDIQSRAVRIGLDLRDTLAELLAGLPERASAPADLVKQLGVNRDIAGRVLQASTQGHGLGVLDAAPGPDPLRKVARAGVQAGAPREAGDRLVEVADRFDRLIRQDAGTRAALDAIISAAHPEARERFELASKASAFRGISQLRGVMCDVWLNLTLVHPSPTDPLRHDVAVVHGCLTMQRLRPGVRVRFNFKRLDHEDAHELPEGKAVPIEQDGLSLEAHCTNPIGRLKALRAGKVVHYITESDSVGPGSATDLLVFDHHDAALDRYTNDPAASKGAFVSPAVPSKLLVFDTLLHAEAYPGSDPDLAIYDMGTEGTAWVNDPARDIDRMDVLETIEYLGRDATRFFCADVPAYQGLIRTVCEHLGWDAAAFRGYRARIQYPVGGWQFCMAFRPPIAPADAPATAPGGNQQSG